MKYEANLLATNVGALVTHEPDIAEYASRVVVFKDGKIKSDRQVEEPRDAAEELKHLPAIIEDEETKRTISACENPFGDGHAGERVADLLATVPIDSKLLNKDLSY